MTTDEFKELWRQQPTAAERLKWARMYWQMRAGAVNGSAKDAADALGMEAGTYRAYERKPTTSKSIKLDHQTAIRFGRRFKIYWVWLLLGEGTPFDNELPPEQERVLRVMSEATLEEQKALAEMVEIFLKHRKAN